MGESWALGEREICPGDMNIFPSLLATHCSTDRPEAPRGHLLQPTWVFCLPMVVTAIQAQSLMAELTIPGWVEDIEKSRGCAGCWSLSLCRKCLWNATVWRSLLHVKEAWIRWVSEPTAEQQACLASGSLALAIRG